MNTSLQQNLPNFQLKKTSCKKTSDTITSKSGLSIFNEATIALGVGDSIENNLPKPGSNRGIYYALNTNVVRRRQGNGRYS